MDEYRDSQVDGPTDTMMCHKRHVAFAQLCYCEIAAYEEKDLDSACIQPSLLSSRLLDHIWNIIPQQSNMAGMAGIKNTTSIMIRSNIFHISY